MSDGRINYEISYQVNKASLDKAIQDLTLLQKSLANQSTGKNGMTKEIKEASKAANELKKILNSAWNPKMGQLNLSKVNKDIKETFGSVKNMQMQLGTKGQAVFNSFSKSVLNTNMQLKKTSKILDDMATTMGNTIKWGITSSIFNNMTSKIHEAFQYTKNLDSSLNDIRIVTDKTADNMERFAKIANRSAKDLGASTLDYTKASLIYYQQGLSDKDVQARTDTTLKAANVTQQSADEVSEQLTAVWNGYKVSASEAEIYVDKLAAVAASTASDLEELSTGMSKVASAANSMGVDVDKLNGMLSTVISVTRQAPESAGTAFKTIFARMGDLKLNKEDEDGVKLGDVSSALDSMGVHILDAQGQMRDLGVVIEEVGNKWSTGAWSDAEKQALAIQLAGKRQYNNLLALFDNWDMYNQAVATSINSIGTLQHQQDIYMDSTEAHFQRLNAEADRFYDTLIDQGVINGITDTFTGITKVVNDLLGTFDSGVSILTHFSGLMGLIFKKQISEGIMTAQTNIQALLNNFEQVELKRSVIDAYTLAKPGEKLGAAKESLGNAIKEGPFDLGSLTSYLESKGYIKQGGKNGLKNVADDEVLLQQIINQERLLNAKNILSEKEFEENTVEQQEITSLHKKFLELQKHEKLIYKIKRSNQDLTRKENKELDEIIQDETKLLELQTKRARIRQLEGYEKLTNKQKAELAKTQKEVQGFFDRQYNKIRGERITTEQSFHEKQDHQDYNAENWDKKQRINNRVSQISSIVSMLPLVISGIAAIGDESKTTEEKVSSLMGLMLMSLPQIAPWLIKVASATKEAGGGFKNFLSAAGGGLKVAAIVAAISLAIWGLKKAYEAFDRSFNAADYKLKEASANVQEYTDSLTKCQERLNSFNEAQTKYESGIEGLSKLKYGTEEYTQALNTANEAARNLIETYGLYADEDYSIKNGVITINEDKLKEKQLDFVKSEREASRNLESFKILENRAFVQKTVSDLGKEFTKASINPFNDNGSYDLFLKNLDNMNQSFLQKDLVTILTGNPVAGVPIEIVDLFKGYEQLTKETSKDFELISNALATKAEDNPEEYDQIIRALRNRGADDPAFEDFIKDVKKTNSAIELNTESLYDYKDQIIKTTKATIEAGEAADYFAKKLVEDDAKDYAEKYSDEETPEAERALRESAYKVTADKEDTAEDYKENIVKIESNVNEKLGNDSKKSMEKNLLNNYDKYSNYTVEDLLREYAKNQGYTDEELKKLHYEEDKGLLNDAGEITISSKDDDNYKRILRNLAIMAEKENITNTQNKDIEQKANKNFDTANKTADSIYGDFSQVIMGLIEGSANIDTVVGQINSKEHDNILNLTENDPKQLVKNFGLDPDDLKNITGETGSIEELAATFAKKIKELLSDWSLEDHEDKANKEGTTSAEAEGFDPDVYEHYRDAVAESNEELEDNVELLNEIALSNMKIDRGLKALNKNWDKLNDTIANGTEIEKAEAITEVEKALQDVLDLTDEEMELLPSDFVEKNRGLIDDVVNGVDGSLQELRGKLSEDYLIKVKGVSDFDELDIGLQDLQTKIESVDPSITIDPSLNPIAYESFINDCNSIIKTAGMTASQATEYFSQLGYKAEVEKVTVPSKYVPWEYSSPQLDMEATKEAGHAIYQDQPLVVKGLNVVPGGEVLAVKSITPKGDGFGGSVGINNRTAGGGGGGGSKSSGPKTSKVNKMSLKKDIYHRVNQKIKKNDQDLSKLDKEQEKLVGKDRIDNLKKETEILNKQTKAYKEKYKIATSKDIPQRQKQIQKELNKIFGKNKIKIKFNEDGTISDYNKLLSQMQKKHNDKVAEYNKKRKKKNLSKKEKEELKKLEKEIKQDESDIKDLTSSMEEYESIVTDLVPETEAALQDIKNQLIEKQIESFKINIELHLDTSKAKKEFLEFDKEVKKGITEKDYAKNAESKMYELEVAKSDVIQLTKQVNSTADQLNSIKTTGTSSIYGDNEQAALEDLRNYKTQLMEAMKDVKNLEAEIENSYIEMLQNAQSEFNDHIEQYEYVSSLLEHDMNLIKLIFGEDSYKELDKYYEALEKNNLKQVEDSKKQLNAIEEQIETIKKSNNNKDKERLKELEKAWRETQSTLNEGIDKSINDLIAKHQNAVKKIFQDWENKDTGNKGFTYIKEEWGLINQNADAYLDKVNSAYEIDKLRRKIQDSIDQTDSLDAQNKLNKLMKEQLSMLEKKEKLTKYDVDRANKLYEIALKEIALKEAEQNKSKMRLRRDSQGNYSYQFVADEEAQNKAQQELDDAENSLYNMDKEAYRKNLDEIYNLRTEFSDKLVELESDLTLTEEERQVRRTLLEEQYGQLINGKVKENAHIRNNLEDSAFKELGKYYEEDGKKFNELAEERKKVIFEKLVPQWTSGLQEMSNALAGKGENGEDGGFIPSCKKAFTELDEATREYDKSLEILGNTAETVFKGTDKKPGINTALGEGIGKAQAFAEANRGVTKTFEEQAASINKTIGSLRTLQTEYNKSGGTKEQGQNAVDKGSKADGSYVDTSGKKSPSSTGGSHQTSSQSMSSSSSTGTKGGLLGPSTTATSIDWSQWDSFSPNKRKEAYQWAKEHDVKNHKLEPGDIVTIKKDEPYWTKKSGGDKKTADSDKTVVYIGQMPGKKGDKRRKFAFGSGLTRYTTESRISGFDTGGYTGNWNSSEGKIAMLHQKEIILNKDDTKNFLSAVNIVRSLDNALSKIKTGMLNFTDRTFNMKDDKQTLQQDVHIEANFPNVTNSEEIEEAFSNLVNYASQYINENHR